MEDVQEDYSTVIRTNFMTNPSNVEVSTPKQVLRTNMMTNPSMEHVTGTSVVRENLLPNPGAERSDGTITIRTNYALHPRGTSSLQSYASAGITQTASVPITGHPEGIGTALRVSYSTGSNPGIALLSAAVPNTTYTVSAWVLHEAIMSTPGQPGFAQAGITSSGHEYNLGVWQRVSWTYTVGGSTNLLGYRVGGQAGTGTGSFLITGMLVEKSSTLDNFFDSASVNSGDFTYLRGADGFHHITAQLPANIGNNTNASRVWQSGDISFNGSKSVRCESLHPTQTGNGLNTKISNLPVGKYTFSAHVYIPESYGATVVIGVRGAGDETLYRGTSTAVSGKWVRLSVTFDVTAATGETWMYLISSGPVPVGSIFFSDAYMLERADALYPYFDGSNPQTNLVSNPNFAVNTSGWGIAGSGSPTMSRDTSVSMYGPASLKVVCNGTFNHQGAMTTTRQTIKPNRDYMASVWVRGEAGKRVLVQFQDHGTDGNEIGDRDQVYVSLSTSDWIKISVPMTSSTSAVSSSVFVRSPDAVPHTFWIGGVLVEEGNHQSEFFDGTGDFTYDWSGTVNQSSSRQLGLATTGITPTTSTTAYATYHQSRFRSMNGQNSLRVIGYGSSQNAWAGPTVTGTVIGTKYTVSAWVYLMPDSVDIELQPSGVPAENSGITNVRGQWVRLYQTFTATGTEHLIRFRSRANGRAHFFVDSVLFEAGAMLRPYFDGTTAPDNGLSYDWVGDPHSSRSTEGAFSLIGMQTLRSTSANSENRFWGYQAFDNGKPIARWVSPAGTPTSSWRVAGLGRQALDVTKILTGKKYTIQFKYRASGWNSSDRGSTSISNAAAGDIVIGSSDSSRFSLQSPEWTLYTRTFIALRDATTESFIYIGLPVVAPTQSDGILEIKDVGIYDENYIGEFFDGNTVSTDPDFSYVWSGVPNKSTSSMRGRGVIGATKLQLSHGSAVSSTRWKSSGSRSIRVMAQDPENSDSFVDISPMLDLATIKPNTTYTLAGTRYHEAPLTGTIGYNAFRVNFGNVELSMINRGFQNIAGAQRIVSTFKTSDTLAGGYNYIRLYNAARAGNGDVWWDDLALYEGVTDGKYIDGSSFNAAWDGLPHKSTSVGYPQTIESLVGAPIVVRTTIGTVSLNTLDIAADEPRTIYLLAYGEDITTSAVDAIVTYGMSGFADSSPNTALTMRLQSSAGPINNVLVRRTNGQGPLINGFPTPGPFIAIGGLNPDGFLFAGRYGVPSLVVDNLKMSIPHESIRIEGNNATHTHIATYIFRGMHSSEVRNEVGRMLAVRHGISHIL